MWSEKEKLLVAGEGRMDFKLVPDIKVLLMRQNDMSDLWVERISKNFCSVQNINK